MNRRLITLAAVIAMLATLLAVPAVAVVGYTVGGTVYDGQDGVTTLSGIDVRLRDYEGFDVTVETDGDGVWSVAGIEAQGWIEVLFTDPVGQVFGSQASGFFGGEDQTFDTYLYPGGTVSGIISDSFGAPVSGATFEMYYGADPVVSGPDGSFALPYPLYPGTEYADVTPPEGSALLPTFVEFEVVEATETVLDVVLEVPGSMSGTVTDASDDSLLGEIGVNAYGPVGVCDGCYVGDTYTDGTGAWSIGGLAPGQYIVEFYDYYSDYATQWFDGAAGEAAATPVVVTAGSDTPLIDAAMLRSTWISGSVEAYGTPIATGVVSVFTDPSDPSTRVRDYYLCCRDATFTIGGIGADTYYLLYDGIGGEHWYGPTGDAADAVAVTPTELDPVEGLVLSIDGVGFVAGVTSSEGVPLADTPVVFAEDPNNLDHYLEPVSGADGSYRIAVPAGTPGFVVTHDPFGNAFYTADPIAVDVADGETLELDIDLVAGLGVPPADPSVTITGATDGTGTYGVPQLDPGVDLDLSVEACPDGGFGYFEVSSVTGYGYDSGELTEGPSGTYTGGLAGGAGPGVHVVDGYVYCDAGFTTGLYTPIALTAVGRDGAPLEGATVTLSDADTGQPIPSRSARLAPVTPSPTQVTNADGQFGWLLQAGDWFDLTLEHGGCVVTERYLDVSYDLLDGTFEVDCGPLPQDAPGLWGKVHDDLGTPLAGMEVALTGYLAPDFEPTVLSTVTTDADGVYAFGADLVDVDEYYDVVAYDPAEQYGADTNGHYIDRSVPERLDLYLSEESSVVAGTVTSAFGTVSGARIQGLGLPLVSGADGSFRSIALRRDSEPYLYVSPPAGSNLYDEYIDSLVLDAPEVTADVYLRAPGGVSGRVTDGSGAPLQGIIVSSSAFGQVRTGSDGTYLASEAYPSEDVEVMFYDETGTYAYEFYDDQPTLDTATLIEVVEGEVTPNIDADLGAGAMISGTVSAVGDEPINGVWVYLETASGSYVAGTETDNDGGYAFGGLQAGSYVVVYEGPAGPWHSGNTADREAAVPVALASGGSGTSNLTVPGVGFVTGSVTESGAGVVGASVYRTDFWGSTQTGDEGAYRLPVASGTPFDLEVYAGQFYESATATGLSVAEGATIVRDFTLTSRLPGGTVTPREGTSVTGSRSTSGLPTLGPSDPLEVTVESCPGGIATFDVVEAYPGSGTAATSVPMVEGPAGTYVGSTDPLEPGRVYEVRIHVDCPGDVEDDDSSFGLYIDPAGNIVDTNGDPIAGATATLYRSEDEGGPYTVVPDGSTIMSPENRTNPDVVGEDGMFQWLTIEGWYKVRAEKPGCKDPGSDATFVETAELPVPPEHVGLILVLDCGEEPPAAPDTILTTGPSEVTNATSATFTFTATQTPATFECKLDTAEWSPCTSPFQTAALSHGVHTFQVRASSDGLTDATPASRTWTVDTVAPQSTLIGGPTGTVSSTTASFVLSADETATFECRLDDGDWAVCTSPKSYAGLGHGGHTFETRATDVAGNVDLTPASRTWTVDTVAPESTVEGGPTGTVSSRGASFALFADEDATFSCRLDDGEWASCTSPATYADLADGDHTFEARATDAAGNVDPTPASRTWTVDTVAPQSTVSGGPTGTVSSTSASFTLSADEEATFECRLDDGDWASCTSPAAYADLEHGSHTFEARATDVVGNLDPTPASRTWTVDTVAPESTVDGGPTGTVSSRSASFTFSADEAATFECRLDAGDWASCTSPKTYTGLTDGDHTFETRATDVAGNVDLTPASRTWTIDGVVPDTIIDSGPSGTVATQSATFTFSATETPATFECKLDDADWASCTSPATYTELSQGAHTVQVRATKGGLTDPTPASRAWTVDTVAPITTLSGGPTGTVTATGASFMLGSETGATFSCRIDAGAWAACTSPKSYSGLAIGTHTFEVRATDTAGNVDTTPASRTWTIKAQDTATPTFTDTGSSTFKVEIGQLAKAGITKGCNPEEGNTEFCPDDFVTRGQMAAFLNRALSLEAGRKGIFSDSKGHLFEADIVALAKAGITKGCNPEAGNTKFCPDDFVTRGQMAAFLNRALPLEAGRKGIFSDSKGHVFEADIVALAKAGITKGCNPEAGNTKFCPDDFVTRGQMAAFLVRAGLAD